MDLKLLLKHIYIQRDYFVKNKTHKSMKTLKNIQKLAIKFDRYR